MGIGISVGYKSLLNPFLSSWFPSATGRFWFGMTPYCMDEDMPLLWRWSISYGLYSCYYCSYWFRNLDLACFLLFLPFVPIWTLIELLLLSIWSSPDSGADDSIPVAMSYLAIFLFGNLLVSAFTGRLGIICRCWIPFAFALCSSSIYYILLSCDSIFLIFILSWYRLAIFLFFWWSWRANDVAAACLSNSTCLIFCSMFY